MVYTQENFDDWIFYMSDKLDYITEEFAKENNLKLNFSIESLDELEKWILSRYQTVEDLINDPKTLDLLTIYIGETFRKYIGGKWFMDLDNKENVYYHMPVLTDPKYKGELYVAPMTFATASIDRQKGNYISTILKNKMKMMDIDHI